MKRSTHRMMAAFGLPALVLAGCSSEPGIDRTVVIGQVQLTPATAEESPDGVASPNDGGFIELPTLSYRHMTVTGTAREFASEEGDADVDTYLFRTDGSGDISMSFEYATESESYWPTREELREGALPGIVDTVNYKVEIIDPAWTDDSGEFVVLASFDDPAGFGGLIEYDWADVSVESAAGGTYAPYADGVPAGTLLAVRVTAVKGDTTVDNSYTLALPGLDPNDGDIIVGAYLNGDPGTKGSPVGGGSAYGFWWDDATLTWTGWYRLEGGMRQVIECEADDQECLDSINDVNGASGGTSGGTTARSGGPDGGAPDGGAPDGGAPDGGTTDGGTTDGGTTDGGTTDGGAPDGGAPDGGAPDGGTTDGGTTDGGTTDGGTTDGGTTDGGTTDGGTTDGGTTDGGTTDGGTTDGGTTDGGTTDGGTTDGGATDGGATDGGPEVEEPSYSGAVNEGVDSVYLLAGTFSSLGGSIPGGTLYSSNSLFVELTGQYVEVMQPVVIDDLSPKVYGWTYTEDGDGSDEAPLAVTELATGAGFVDVIEGSLLYEIDDPQYANENDGYLISVAEESGAIVTMSWSDAGANMDFYVWHEDGTLLADPYVLGDATGGPEGFNAVSDYDFTFEPGVEYLITIEAWTGTAGEKPYNIEFEWTSP